MNDPGKKIANTLRSAKYNFCKRNINFCNKCLFCIELAGHKQFMHTKNYGNHDSITFANHQKEKSALINNDNIQ